MKIRVDCKGTAEPHAFYLGERRLHVVQVLERARRNSEHSFRVRVADGRAFLLRHDTRTGEWQLERVNSIPRGRKRAPA